VNVTGKVQTLQDQMHRCARIVKGLGSPSTRPGYVAEVRRRIRGGARPGPDPALRCLVCRGQRVRATTVTRANDPTSTRRVRICRDCGYISNPYNMTSDYRGMETFDALPEATRAGTRERRGREFHIARMAIDILGRRDLEVLVYGAGRSFDNHHVAALPQVRHVAIGDIMKVRDDAEFIDLNEPAPRRFPVVIASEVVEHFRDPRADFAKLFTFVEKDGLIVCGTNIYAGGDLARDPYLFLFDHTSYYTPQALRRIADDAGFHLDFRAPLVGRALRKRYVFLTRSTAVLEDIACYFAIHAFAPSENSRRLRPTAPRARQE
jgi:hypothetical protein